MHWIIKLAVTVLALLISRAALADTFPRVDADLAEYDAANQKMKDEFATIFGDATSKDWVKKKLQHMVDIDQHMRNSGMSLPHDHQYTKAEQDYFFKQFLQRWQQLASTTAIQLWFRVQAKRSQFRRRQTSSRLATFAEAFSSIGWAATAALALAIPAAAMVSGLMTAVIVAATWKLSPRRD